MLLQIKTQEIRELFLKESQKKSHLSALCLRVLKSGQVIANQI